MLILIGKSASGKDTITNKLIKDYGFKKLITYTTRPMRKGEVEGVTYHYISDEDFLNKVNNGFFAEWKKYKTTQGVWYYGSAIEDYAKSDNNTVIILTPDGVRDIKKLGFKDIKIFYIFSDKGTIKKRLSIRGDNPDEVIRRMEKDDEDFKDITNLVDETIMNTFNSKISSVVNEVYSLYKKRI